ncbi:MAG: DUF6326 family protein [Owenweeksia sp.]
MHTSLFQKKSIHPSILLSTLWVFVLMNMIYADIIGTLRPGYIEMLDQISKELDQLSVLMFSVLMEIPIVMILLSLVLNQKVNRIANLVAVPLSIIWVIYGGLTDPPLSYLFFGSVEVAALLFIGWTAFKWNLKQNG